MKSNIKNTTKLFMCILDKKIYHTHKAALCDSELNKNSWFYNIDNIPGDYQVKYIAAYTSEEALVKFEKHLKPRCLDIQLDALTQAGRTYKVIEVSTL